MPAHKVLILALAIACGSLPGVSRADEQGREGLVDFVCGALQKMYFDPAKAASLCKEARKIGKSQAFAQTDPAAQAKQLTALLRGASSDKHFYVGLKEPDVPPVAAAVPASEPTLSATANGGWVELRILPGNIGYVKWTQHVADDAALAKITSALQFLNGVDALIFDISNNGGGDGRASGFVNQHLFEDEEYQGLLRKKCRGEQHWKISEVAYHYSPAPKFYRTPVYIMVSDKTGSAAEYFAFIGQETKRATVLGSTTAGAGNPVGLVATDDYVAYIPMCEIQTVAGKSIERVGVVPDVALTSNDRVQETLSYVRQDLAKAKLKQPDEPPADGK